MGYAIIGFGKIGQATGLGLGSAKVFAQEGDYVFISIRSRAFLLPHLASVQ